MSDLSYTVSAKGAKDVEALTHSLEALHKVLDSGKGSGKSLQEIRRLITGFKGQASVFEEMRDSMRSMTQTLESMAQTAPRMLRNMSIAIGKEMQKSVAAIQTAGTAAGTGFTDSLGDGIGQGVKKVKSRVRAQVAELQAAYESELAKGVKFSGRDLFDLKAWGVNIGADAKAGIRDGLLKDPKPIPADMLLGITKANVKTTATEYSNIFSNTLTAELSRRQQGIRDFEKLVGITPTTAAKSAKESAEAYKAVWAAEMRNAQRSTMSPTKMSKLDASDLTYASSMSQMRAYYTELQTKQAAVAKTSGDLTRANGTLGASFKRLALDGNDVHSMARGLASGFNLLWLTWGNLAPLFIGAALSNGFMQTAKQGMAVAQSLETIAALGMAPGATVLQTAKAVGALSDSIIELGRNGIFTPVEIAESMKTLSLAGLDVTKVMSALPAVMDLAVAGTTSLANSADVLVSVTTAFNMGAGGFGKAADIIVRAAADSKASVESIGNAMKLASVAGEQYGATLEDVGGLIGLLANLGIQGSAAGTAIRNMFVDMSERTPKVAKIMRQFGLDFRDATTGDMKPLLGNIAQLDKALRTLDGVSGKNLLQAIFSERGGKAAVAALAAYRQSVVDANGVTEKWSETNNGLSKMLDAMASSAGDASIAAIKMSQSTENSFKSAAASLQTSMFEAFRGIEPYLYTIALRMREAFSSPEAIAGIATLTKLVAGLGVVLVENIGIISAFLGAFAGLKLLGMLAAAAATGIGSLMNVMALFRTGSAAAGFIASAEAMGGAVAVAGRTAAVAGGSVATLATRFLALGRLIPGVGVAVTGLSVALALNNLLMGKGSSARDTAVLKSNELAEKLEQESARLDEINKYRAEGLTKLEAEAKLKERLQRLDINAGSEVATQAAQAKIADARAKMYATQAAASVPVSPFATIGGPLNGGPIGDTGAAQRAAKEARENYFKALREGEEVEKLKKQANERLDNAVKHQKWSASESALADAQEQAKALKAQRELMEGAVGGGSGKFSLLGEDGAGGKGSKFSEWDLRVEQKALTEVIKLRDARLKSSRDTYSQEKALLDNAHQNELISWSEYTSKMITQTQAYEAEQIAIRMKGAQDYETASEASIRNLQEKQAQAQAKGDTRAADNFASLIQTQRDAAVREAQTAADAIEQIQLESFARVQKSVQDIRGEAVKLLNADDKIWSERKSKLETAQALEEVNQQYKFLNTSVFSAAEAEKAYAVAMRNSRSEVSAQNRELEKLAQKYEDAAAALLGAVDFSDSGKSQQILLQIDQLLASAGGLRDRVAKNTAQGFVQGAEEGSLAMAQVMAAKRDYLVNGIADAIDMGIFEGAQEGAKAMRKLLEDELLRKPFKAFIQAGVSLVLNGIFGGGFGGGGGGGGAGGGGGGLIGMGLQGAQLYTGLTSGQGVLGTVGNWLGLGAGAGAVGAGAWGGAAVAGSYAAPGIGAVGSLGGVAAGGGFASAAAAVMPWLLGAAAVAALWKPLFGRTLKDSGIEGTFGGESGFEGRSYKFYKGGLFRSDKTEYDTLDEKVRKSLGDTYKAMREQTIKYADVLGLSTDRLKGFTSSLKLSLHGLSDADAQKKIEEALATANDELAQQVLGTWTTVTEEVTRQIQSTAIEMENGAAAWRDVTETITTSTYQASEFAKEGETASETLARLATSLSLANTWFARLGATLFESSLGGADRASDFIDAMGGKEAFDAQASAYYGSYYTTNQRRQAARREVEGELGRAGVRVPSNAIQFRQDMDAALAAGEAGRETAAALFRVAPAFAEVTTSIADMEQAMGMSAQSIKGILDSAIKNATSAEEARKLASEGFEQAMYEGMTGMLTQQISQMMMDAVIGPMVDNLILGSIGSSAAMVAGGATGGAAVAGGGAAGGAAVAAGGAAAGGAMAAGGAAAGKSVADAVAMGREFMAGFAALMNDPVFQDFMRDVSSGMGDIAADIFDTTGGFQSAGTAMNYASSSAGGMADSVNALGDAIEEEIKRLRGLLVDDSISNGKDFLLSEFTTATAAARAGDQTALERLPELSQKLEAATRLQAGSSVELNRMRGWLAGSLEQTRGQFTAQTDAQRRAAMLAMNEPGYDIRDTPRYANTWDANPIYTPWEEGTVDSRYDHWFGTTPRAGTGNLRGMDPNAAPDIRYTGGGIGASTYDARDPNYMEDWRYRDTWSADPYLRNPRPSWYGPSYAVGTDYVPSDGLAYLHKGEAVLTKEENQGRGGVMSNLVAGIQALRQEVATLRQQQQAEHADAQRLRLRAVRPLERMENGGIEIREPLA